MNGKTLLLGLLIVTGIYLLPSVTARFAGTHTMERDDVTSNGVSSAANMACGVCHSYVFSELTATTTANNTMIKHMNAYATTGYTSKDGRSALQIGTATNETYTYNTTTKVCLLCHLAETTIAGSHTQVLTRVCTDTACHGFKSGVGQAITFGGQNVTEKLSLPTDAHRGFLVGSNKSSTYYAYTGLTGNFTAGENQSWIAGGYYTTAFYACLGCHTFTAMSFNLSRVQNITMNVTIYMNGTADVENVNAYGRNISTSGSGYSGTFYRQYGSVW